MPKKGYKQTKEHIEKLRKLNLNKKLSLETRKKISIALKSPSIKTRNKIRSYRIGKKHSKETKLKMSLSMKGKKHINSSKENHWNWRGGINSINDSIRKSLEYKLWRTAIFERDNYQCVWCGAKSGMGKAIKLNADHIKPFALYPELRFSIDNGRTLCVSCHRTTDTWGTNYKKLII
jgi:5-methylcytosine-specific restriction endonuclease McrA